MGDFLSLLMLIAVAAFVLGVIVTMVVSVPGIARLVLPRKRWSELKNELEKGENPTIRRMIWSGHFLNRVWLLALVLGLAVILYAGILELVKQMHR